MSDLNYHHLRYFWAVAHDGNLTRTAERLNLSQSALSSQIRTLEDRLGHALFDRRGRQLHLTEAGRIALDHADTIFATGTELLGTLAQTGQVRRPLRVGSLATLSRNFQTGFLRPLFGRADVEIVLRAGSARELYAALADLSLDVVLTNRPPARDAGLPFVSHRIAAQRVGLFGTPPHLEGLNGDPAGLREVPLILPTLDSALRADFDAWADRTGLRPQIAAEVDDMAMMRLLARDGLGLALVPPIVVQDELEAGSLGAAPIALDITETFLAVTVARRFPNPLLREVLDTAAARLSDPAPVG
jgi:LysR family transcriptional activator of nhaA